METLGSLEGGADFLQIPHQGMSKAFVTLPLLCGHTNRKASRALDEYSSNPEELKAGEAVHECSFR
jgi:hypothetical protein